MEFLPGGLMGWPLLVLGLAAWWLRKVYLDTQFRKFALRNHCLPEPTTVSKWPMGLDRMVRLFKVTAAEGDVLEALIHPTFLKLGWTWSFSVPLSYNTIATADPDNIKAILSTQFKEFPTGFRRAGAFGYVVGKCLFTVDGAEWEHARALFRPHFARGEVNNLEATEEGVRDLLAAVTARGVDEGHRADDPSEKGRWTPAFDFMELIHRYTLDVGTETFFGANVKSQLAAIPGVKIDQDPQLAETRRVAADQAGASMSFAEAYKLAALAVAKRLRLQAFYWLVNPRDSARAVKYLRGFASHLAGVQLKQLSQKAAIRDDDDKKDTFLKSLARDTQDPTELCNQTLFLLTASRDTTASLLSWLFLMLAKHPRVFDKLRAEIVKEFGTRDEPRGQITFYRLKKCQYLQWTLNETLRLQPPGPLNSRQAAVDTTLPTGGGPDGRSPIAVRKGQPINLCIYTMHRRQDLWGEDALEYRPERWENRKNDWSFLPFSGGPKICLGSECTTYYSPKLRFERSVLISALPSELLTRVCVLLSEEYALAEASFLTVRMLQEFDKIEPVGDIDHIRQIVLISMEPTDGVRVRFRRAA
ncbi:uncharacterized protein E0L32_004211 [Thyridium curvatum]|uniref:Cytochrome P450 n=1 Tax=Thyridium curvatum TaxID=1093900 RepID=A0A507BAH6_9PEZI|nr:uncharacterized protein E0L32_004211 [Thyridium curvatum]TPX16216.1 hypothetical protein E0L32_004211 [Thyridium curvatum]